MVSTPHDFVADQEPYTGDFGSGARHQRRFQILIADNDPYTLSTTSEYFEGSEFDIISVRSTHAARLLINLNADALDAIVLDGRLTKDEDERDRSGYKLAEELRARFANLPIIIYSRYEDTRDVELEQDGITFVSKYVKHEVVDRVRKVIRLRGSAPRMPARTIYSTLPVVIFSDQSDATDQLQAELMKHGVQAWPCATLPALLDVALYLRSAMFVIYLDADSSREAVEAIRSLRELRDASWRDFYVVALADHGGSGRDEPQVGADVLLPRDSAKTDALELVTRILKREMERDAAAANRPQTLLALHWYKQLVGQLQELKESPALGMAAPTETVERALNWPFLTPEEQLVLTSLYMQMLAAGANAADSGTIDLCIEGANMLADDRAQRANVHEWVERATQHSPDFTLAWFKEEFLKEIIEDDPEEGDD